MEDVLTLEDVRFRWPGGGGAIDVARFSVARGERVLLLGPSGSGKSTLLGLICGTLRADEGRVCVDGTDLGALRPGARDRYRAETTGVIFQQFNLLPFASVADNVLLPLRFAPRRRSTVARPQADALRLVTALGLPQEVMTRRAGGLSVGQQQRVAAARALIGAPPLVVADEPTSALDADSQTAFLDLLFTQTRATDASVLMVSHDARLGAAFDRVVEIDDLRQAVPA